ncbi:MAG: glycerol-3-phosphate dehydrogenase/oxidase [bacterium]
MRRDVSRFENRTFDLLVIGGGINGAAIAHLAAAAGASVALIEKNDWASGASSATTKLLHGGIRYLEQFELGLVRESLRERFIQLAIAPHLARSMGFVIPVYRTDTRPLWLMTLGVWIYQVLSGRWSLGKHRGLTRQEIEQRAPGIAREGLIGGVAYFDAQMNDARICLENVLMADHFGAVVANGVQAEAFIRSHGTVIGVQARDTCSNRSLEIRAARTVVAAGPWSDELIQKDLPGAPRRLRVTKGVHVIYDMPAPPQAFLLPSRQDNRVFFMIPFQGRTLIGTTDTDYTGSPDQVAAEEEDIHYLLREASRVFPEVTFERSRIIASFAGLRPLVVNAGNPSCISRQHALDRSASGVYFVMGGKYTTYRHIAEKVVQKVLPHLAHRVLPWHQFRLYGSGTSAHSAQALASQYGVSEETVRYLLSFYGSRAADVLELTLRDVTLKQAICSCSPAIAAQASYARDVEMARSARDILERRLGLSYLRCADGACRRKIEALFA